MSQGRAGGRTAPESKCKGPGARGPLAVSEEQRAEPTAKQKDQAR